ncbi:MAG: hypothetical protein AAGC93_18420 [Cyanobacteria bacterium P01_F01_bin.53]
MLLKIYQKERGGGALYPVQCIRLHAMDGSEGNGNAEIPLE